MFYHTLHYHTFHFFSNWWPAFVGEWHLISEDSRAVKPFLWFIMPSLSSVIFWFIMPSISSVIFYVLAPIPYTLARRYSETSYSGSNCGLEVALFLTSVLVISAYGKRSSHFITPQSTTPLHSSNHLNPQPHLNPQTTHRMFRTHVCCHLLFSYCGTNFL